MCIRERLLTAYETYTTGDIEKAGDALSRVNAVSYTHLTGNEVSVVAMIGFVMLAGIIVNNGIVMVDFINQLRRGGMEKKDAIIESGKTRLRPILMTALTTILSMSTMAVGLGEGSEMRCV